MMVTDLTMRPNCGKRWEQLYLVVSYAGKVFYDSFLLHYTHNPPQRVKQKKEPWSRNFVTLSYSENRLWNIKCIFSVVLLSSIAQLEPYLTLHAMGFDTACVCVCVLVGVVACLKILLVTSVCGETDRQDRQTGMDGYTETGQTTGVSFEPSPPPYESPLYLQPCWFLFSSQKKRLLLLLVADCLSSVRRQTTPLPGLYVSALLLIQALIPLLSCG